jgi:hypothetical protein
MPFANRLPLISLEEPPTTLANTEAFEFGWINFTVSFSPILKELKFITALSSAVIFRVDASGYSKLALPASTDCPSGRAKACDDKANHAPMITKFKILNAVFVFIYL